MVLDVVNSDIQKVKREPRKNVQLRPLVANVSNYILPSNHAPPLISTITNHHSEFGSKRLQAIG